MLFENKFHGRGIVKKPLCPFCGMPIERPKELRPRRSGEMPVGACVCGAVYAYDETGHNLGLAMIEALVFGCDMDWDLAWGLLPEDDYKEGMIEHYDHINHLVVPGGFFESRRISGVLYFIKMQEDIQEVTSDGVVMRLKKATPIISEPNAKEKVEYTLSKGQVEDCVRNYKIKPVLRAAEKDKKLIRNLQRLLYSGDHLFRKRAAEFLGEVCAIVSENDSRLVSRLLDTLFFSITDTAAFPYGAFEAIGEIIADRTEIFGGYTPRLFQFLADETRRSQALQAIGRIARSNPELIRRYTFHFIPFLEDPDPEVRGYTAWLLGNLGASELRQDLKERKDDPGEIIVYEDGILKTKRIGQIISEALDKL